MSPNFPIDESYLVASWVAASLWGAFSVLFLHTMISIVARKEARPKSTVIIFLICVMYLLATVHVSITLARNIEAFIKHITDEGGAVLYLADIGQPLNRSKDMIYVTLIVLADFVLLWRCFMVWNKNFYVIFIPTVMIIGTAVSGYGAVGRYFTPDAFTAASVRWAEGMLAVSMATNILLSLLSAGRIWYLARETGSKGVFWNSKSRYNRVILLILETGVVMTISKTMEFILFMLAPDDGLNGLNALYIVMDAMPQIMSICPTLMIIAVSRGFTAVSTEAGPSGLASGSITRANISLSQSLPPFVAAPKTTTFDDHDEESQHSSIAMQTQGMRFGKKGVY